MSYKMYIWFVLISLCLWGITDRLITFGSNGLVIDELILITLPIVILGMILSIKPPY